MSITLPYLTDGKKYYFNQTTKQLVATEHTEESK